MGCVVHDTDARRDPEPLSYSLLWMWRWLVLLAVSACGRGFFDPQLASNCDGAPPANAPNYIQSNFNTSGSGQTQTISVPFAVDQLAGDTVLVAVMWDGTTPGTALATISDDAGDSFMQVAGPTQVAAGWTQSVLAISNIAAHSGGSNGLYVDLTAPARMRVVAVEYSGLDPTTPFAMSSSATGLNGTTVASKGIAVTAGQTVVAFASSDSMVNADFAAYTQRVTSQDLVAEDRQFTASSSPSPASSVPSGAWVVQLIALRGL